MMGPEAAGSSAVSRGGSLPDFIVTAEAAAHASLDAWRSRRYDWLNPHLSLAARDEADTMMPEMVSRLHAVLELGFCLFDGEVWVAGNLSGAGFLVTNFRTVIQTCSGKSLSLGYPDLSLYSDQKPGFLSFRIRGTSMAIPMDDLLHHYYPLPAPVLRIHGAREWAEHLPKRFWPAISMTAQEAEKRFNVVLPIEQIANVATWIIAIDGQQFGPYDAGTLKGMIRSKQIDPLACLVWCEGMDYWAPLNQEPRLQAALSGQPAAGAAGAASAPAAASVSAPAAPQPQPQPQPRPEQSSLVDVNNASVEDLLSLEAMTLERAELLISERASRLGFACVEEVGEVLGLQPHQVERLRGQVRIGEFKRDGPVTSARGRVIDF